ncbi:MAG TPA: TonB-dependent receptor [Terracidiphilus sp.]|nr:TonB-dependent receptor [Terracidiphilus sp.]
MWRLRIVFSLAICIFAVKAFAQTGGNVAITGTVSDPSGAVVSGAKVTVTQLSTSTVHTATANGDGLFNFASLPASTYTVTVEASGFKKWTQTVVMLADQVRNMDVRLEVGTQTQQITVQESAVQVNTVNPTLSQVVEQQRLVDIPLNGRNAADLTLMVPGAISANANNSGALQGDTKQIPGADAIAVNGARPDQIAYNMDGGNNEDLMSNVNDPFPMPDDLQEFSVQTNSFDAQYGANAGAVVNVVTKSGTNKWHGTAFEFVRNRAFNGTNYFASAKDPLKRNQFGIELNGPIHRDTTFFAFGWQKTIVRSVNNASNATIPTAANVMGDFSNYLTAGPTNPLSGGKTVVLQNPWYRQALTNNTNNIASLLDPVAVAMTKLMPISSASANGFVTYGTPLQQNFNEYLARVDQVIHGQNRLFGRAYFDKYVHAPTYDGKDILTDGPGSSINSFNIAVGYTWVLSPSIVNNTVIDAIRSNSDRGQQGGPGGTVPDMKSFGSQVYQLPTAQSGIRSFAVSGDFTLGNFTDAHFIRNTGDLRDVLSWSKGKHQMSFGADLEMDQSNIRNTDLLNGNWSINADNSGLAMANFMMGYQNAFSQTSGDWSDSRENPLGFFAQDNWKVTHRLSLTLGVRYEPQQVMKEIRGRIQNFHPDAQMAGVHSTVVPTAPAGLFFIGDSYNGVGVPTRGETGDFNNIGPRLGVAWDPTGTGKMSIRAGGGLFYESRLPGLFLNDAAISSPFSLRIDLIDCTSNTACPSGTLSSMIGGPNTGLVNPLASNPNFTNGFPQRFTLANAPKNAPFVANPALFSLQPGVSWHTPEVYDYNVTYEYQVRPDMVLHASYVGTRGTHLRQDQNLNPGIYGNGATEQLSRPYQPFSYIYENRNTGGNRYDGLQLDVEKRPTGGAGILNQITLLANYTYSKATDYGLAENGGITDIGSSAGSNMSFYNPQQHDFETGPATFDHTHRFVVSYVWDLPKLTGANGALRSIVGGWQWTGLYSYQTGDPLTILSGSDNSQTNNGNDRVNYIGPAGQLGKLGTPTPCNASVTHCVAWMSTVGNFAAPATGTYGNVGKGTYRGPTLWDMDTGVLKNIYPIPSRENLSFQLRGEFFNVFNHPQWADPNVTFNNAAFGTIRGTIGTNADYRIIQLSGKLNF